MKVLKLIFPSLLLVTFFMIQGSAVGISCEDCHSSSNPSGNWLYHPPILTFVHDPFYPPNTTFTMRLKVTGASDYQIKDLSATLDERMDNLEVVGELQGRTGTDADGDHIVEWELRTLDEGWSNVSAEVRYKVYYKHNSPGASNEASYVERISTSPLSANFDLSVTPGTLFFDTTGQQRELTLTALNNVTDIRLEIIPGLEDIFSIEVPRSDLNKGDSMTVMITLQNMTDMYLGLTLKWKEGETERRLPIRILISDPGQGSGGKDILWEVGKYTGIAAFTLLVIGYFTGGAVLKEKANKFFKGAKRRVDFHCALSYVLLVLVLIHLSTLFYGPYRELILQWEVVLGWVALGIMMIIALNGIFQRWLVKKDRIPELEENAFLGICHIKGTSDNSHASFRNAFPLVQGPYRLLGDLNVP